MQAPISCAQFFSFHSHPEKQQWLLSNYTFLDVVLSKALSEKSAGLFGYKQGEKQSLFLL